MLSIYCCHSHVIFLHKESCIFLAGVGFTCMRDVCVNYGKAPAVKVRENLDFSQHTFVPCCFHYNWCQQVFLVSAGLKLTVCAIDRVKG